MSVILGVVSKIWWKPKHHVSDIGPEEDQGSGLPHQRRGHARDYAQKTEEETVVDYNAPIHWWVMSTLFPLIAGTFGPIASAFNIMSIATDWRTTVKNTSTESEGIPVADPGWLVAINGLSLALAIIANFALLGQMTDQVHYATSGPITITGWYISSFLLIGLVAAAPGHLPLPAATPAAYSQAFYYACFAAAIYLILSIMLTATAIGVFHWRFTDGYKLTMNQRSLMLQTMFFLGYLLAAAAVLSRIEGWKFLDAVYFVNVTLFTIGFGEITPKSHLGRSLYFPMAVGGILLVGLIISSIRTLVLESGSRKISMRMIERARDKALHSKKTLHVREDREDTTELVRREEEFNIMRSVQRSAKQTNRLISLVVSSTAFFLLWTVGAVVFWQAERATGGEDWTYFEALYFTYTALLTIGYGDFYPQTNAAKPAFVFWSLVALPTLTVLIGAIGDTVSDVVAASTVWLGDNLPEKTGFVLGLKKGSQREMKHLEGVPKPEKRADLADDAEPHACGSNDQDHATATTTIANGRHPNAEVDNAQAEAALADDGFRLYAVIKEMKNVVEHLDASPPHRYGYSEWSWALKLIYEDEATPDGHRRPWHDQNLVQSPLRNHEHQVWSWLGQESPLMSMEDEPKWLMRRLLDVVEREIKRKRGFEGNLKIDGV